MARIRREHPELRRGRCYQRELSYDGQGFDLPHKLGPERHTGVTAWSRILGDAEIVLAINGDLEREQAVFIVVDGSLHEPGDRFERIYATGSAEPASAAVAERSGQRVIQVAIPAVGAVAFRRSR